MKRNPPAGESAARATKRHTWIGAPTSSNKLRRRCKGNTPSMWVKRLVY